MRTTRLKLKRRTPIIICSLILLALLAGGYVLAKDKFFPSINPEAGPVTADQRLNVLLLGIDARQGESAGRTDSIILASVDPKSKQMSLLSIPRDTRVNIPGHGWDKINSAAVYGGPELSAKVVSNLVGIPIKYYVVTNFGGFKDIVDALGGVTLDVEQNMYHEGDEEYGGAYGINLKKGVQRLNGEKALQYVRYRDYAMGDIDRTKHQQKFLVALAKEMLQPSTIPKLPKLVPEINRYVKTNLSVSDMITMASASKSMENGNIVAQTLPGRPLDIDGGSFWGVDPNEARQMVARLLNGETTTNIVLETPLSSRYTGPVGLKPPVQPKTDETLPANTQPPAVTQTKPAQNGTKPLTTKPGQGTQSGTNGSGATVIITPGGTGSGTKSGTTTTKPPSSGSGTQSGTGTSDKTGTSGTGGTNPGIPGATKTSTSTS